MKEESRNRRLEIRRLTAEEVGIAAALEQECFADPWSREGLAEGLEAGTQLALLAEQGGEPVGYCLAQQVLDEGELLRIGVAPEARRQGIGRRLLEALWKECPQVQSWYLEVREGNLPAVSLYRQQGFQTAGIRKNYYRNPVENAFWMYRKED